MPLYPVTDKKSGKSYQMPWDHPTPPTPLDAKQYIWEQENPTPMGTLKNIGKAAWDIGNAPLTDLPSRAGRAIGEPLLDYGMNNDGLIAKMARGAGAFSEGVGDVTSSLTSPINLGLTALTAGSGTAAKLGFGRTAEALAAPGKAAAVGMVGHGGYRVATEPTLEGKLGGGVEAGLGLLGARGGPEREMRSPPPQMTPEEGLRIPHAPSTGGRWQFGRARPDVPIDAEYTVSPQAREIPAIQGPPESQPRALPPARRVFYGGQRTVSPNLEDISPTGLTPAESTMDGLVPNRFKPPFNPPRMVDQIGKGPLNVNRVDTSLGDIKELDASRPKQAPRSLQEISKSPYARTDDADVEFLARQGDKDALAEAARRPTLKDRLKRLFTNEVGAVGDLKNSPLNPENSQFKVDIKPSESDNVAETLGPFKTMEEALAAAKAAGQKAGHSDFWEGDDAYNAHYKLAGSIGTKRRGGMWRAEVVDNGPKERRVGGVSSEGVSERRQAELMDKFGGQKQEPEARDSVVQRLLKDEKGQLVVPGVGGTQPASEPASQIKHVNKTAAKDWATRRNAAKIHGQFLGEDFKDLAGQPDLIDKFEAGDRTGRLADVQKVLDQMYEDETAAGIEMRNKSNYMRHIFQPEVDTEGVAPAIKGGTVPKIPSFAKSSTFKTYAQARAAGKIPKFDDLPSLLAERMRESKQAIANHEFYDYLNRTKQLAPGKAIREPSRWTFTGPESKTLQGYATNVLASGWDPLDKVAQGVSKTKNIYLAGGIPGTPLNIHGYNIARSQYMASGAKGIGDFMKGVFDPKGDIAYVKSQRPLIQKALDYGYQMRGENTDPSVLENLLSKSMVGRGANKAFHMEEKIFEDPLFKVRLPAAKAKVLRENYDRLLPKLGEEGALRKASEIANDFMGGINKSLRNKTGQDLLQIGILAPDWAESRINLAIKGAKALIGKEDPIYRKALVRGGAMRATGAAASAAASAYGLHKTGDKTSDITSIGLGKTESGKIRELPIYGTAVEGLRLPEQAIRGGMKGDFSPALKIVNNRLSQPVQSGINLIRGQDVFGNPLSGKDKYGKKISFGRAAANYGREATAPFQPQQLQAALNYFGKKQGLEETVAQGLELPLTYSSIPNKGNRRFALRRPR